jgi:hypothetical protein
MPLSGEPLVGGTQPWGVVQRRGAGEDAEAAGFAADDGDVTSDWTRVR